ncbi:heavy-metal-associated domain-containing protein [Dinghuibacter silviterrae]|uniref:Heavy-metal-associated domain-containing protein n=1 Tax=Dinghuibacter silviterrae TaxID=1539049 RepID=A0A4R8DUA1_9BACT|nr:heavy-metal-associated domain-containing protein [Dinghuibacter silviterrae]TDX01942.1 heavy-metal-associated domain-containing protein [Dinghuibacter silviterrae]
MRTIKALLFTVFSLIGLASFAQNTTTTTFKVSGNCSTCKKHIEGAALLPGVAKVDWNKDTKILTLVYNPTKVSVDDVQKRIAAVGYDTPKYRGDDKAYNKLDECCQYDRKP